MEALLAVNLNFLRSIMIELTVTQAFLLYLGFTISILLGLWSHYHYRVRKQRVSLLPQRLHVCEYCRTAYLAEVEKAISRCPCCQSFNTNDEPESRGARNRLPKASE